MANFAVVPPGLFATGAFPLEYSETSPDRDSDNTPQFQDSFDLLVTEVLTDPAAEDLIKPAQEGPKEQYNPWAMLFHQGGLWIQEPVQKLAPPQTGNADLPQESPSAPAAPVSPAPLMEPKAATAVQAIATSAFTPGFEVTSETVAPPEIPDENQVADGELQPAPASAAESGAAEIIPPAVLKPVERGTRLVEPPVQQAPRTPEPRVAPTGNEEIAVPVQGASVTLEAAPPATEKPLGSRDRTGERSSPAIFSSQPAGRVRNPVPSSNHAERLAFEVELSDDADTIQPQAVSHRGDSEVDAGPSDPGPVKMQLRTSTAPETHSKRSDPTSAPEASPAAPERVPTDASPAAAEHARRPALRTDSRDTSNGPPSTPTVEQTSGSTLRRAMEASAPESSRPAPGLARVQLQVSGANENVRVQLAQIAGNVRVAVHAADPSLVQNLQAGLPELIEGIEQSGVHITTLVSDNGSPIATEKTSAISQNSQGNLQWSNSNHSDSQSGFSSGRHPRHKRPEQHWQEWLEER